jgi:hypothetical protein
VAPDRLRVVLHAAPHASADGTERPVLSSIVSPVVVMNAPGWVLGLSCHVACMSFLGPCVSCARWSQPRRSGHAPWAASVVFVCGAIPQSGWLTKVPVRVAGMSMKSMLREPCPRERWVDRSRSWAEPQEPSARLGDASRVELLLGIYFLGRPTTLESLASQGGPKGC